MTCTYLVARPDKRTRRPEFTKEVCRQTEVYVRHMTRFDTFFTNQDCKNASKRVMWRTKTKVCRQTSFVNSGHRVPKCDVIIGQVVKVAASKIVYAKQWRCDNTSAKHWICPTPARCLNNAAVSLMRTLCCLEPVTETPSEYDVSTSVYSIGSLTATERERERERKRARLREEKKKSARNLDKGEEKKKGGGGNSVMWESDPRYW